ncbi:Cell pattern formation-associated protein [Drechslerella dactyloides]|uniref:Cell pattern formation-associated protein n=1 Tax=Drechslerella dactyloides TaxID=74499 RepID=A0AAD6IZD2_DREDA|nr:Cell pattern formation-associated protein [Drechslerella dactyloides]
MSTTSSKLPLPVPGHSAQSAPGSVSAYSTSGSHYSAHPVTSTPLASQPYYSHDTSVAPQYLGMDSYSHQSYSQPQSASGHTPASAGLSYGSSHMPPPYEPQHTSQGAYSQFPYPTTSMPSTLSSSVSTQGPFRGVMTPGAGPLVSSRTESNMLDTYNKAIYPATPDTTGQVCPPGAKPRVTATLWEDEGSLCFQVEAKGVCVARREDNHMINGTKLLNVAGMTRGRRDGILKSEKVRHVVKIGPMHLKGVWIPFQRALDFANKEKITELLYPLFVHNIGALLYHPTNSTRTSAVIHAARREGGNPWTSVPPALPSSLPTQGPGSSGQPGAPNAPTPQRRSTDSLVSPASVSSAGTTMAGQTTTALVPSHPLQTHRPSLERSITFPTPPSSASSIMMPNADSQFWPPSNIVPANQPLALDTATMASSRSMPATPATTPPGGNQLQSYSSSSAGTYGDAYRNVPSQSNMGRYPGVGQQPQYLPNGRAATDMGPPQTARPGQANPSSRPSSSQNDGRIPNLGESSSLGHHHGGNSAEHGEEEADHEEEYTHDSNLQGYNASRSSYYPSSTILPSEHSAHHSPEINGGTDVPRSTYDASNVAVPRTVDTPGARAAPDTAGHWNSGSTYTTSPHLTRYDSYASNGDRTSDSQSNSGSYGVQSGIVSLPTTYGEQAPSMTSSLAGTKRGREDDDGPSRPSSRAGDSTDPDGMGIKRRKTGMPSPASSFNGTNNIPRRTAIPTGVQQRRR